MSGGKFRRSEDAGTSRSHRLTTLSYVAGKSTHGGVDFVCRTNIVRNAVQGGVSISQARSHSFQSVILQGKEGSRSRRCNDCGDVVECLWDNNGASGYSRGLYPPSVRPFRLSVACDGALGLVGFKNVPGSTRCRHRTPTYTSSVRECFWVTRSR
ncbi:hypothetical protein EVAR_25557_1 [Eumeta japonica]|uniref:Uncharacterized protein n=1 Tax=Eumeta variegata TaxID=151549 RepID=A0A4C1Z759_EUMVA|nr:hypothetical protein EVAR_25557_1 [Eumeta japonica]